MEKGWGWVEKGWGVGREGVKKWRKKGGRRGGCGGKKGWG